MKHVPNIITLSRLLLCVPIAIIFARQGFNTVGMVLFIIACFTDMIDGTIARAVNNGEGTKLGQVLDSLADMALVVVAALFIIPKMLLPDYPILFWLCMAGFAYKVLSSLVGYIKHKSVSMLIIHTYLMRSLGYILFVWVLLHWILNGPNAITNGYTIFVIASIFILTTEELLISLLLKGPSSDVRTIFQVKRENQRLAKEKNGIET
ncbi:MAG: CDP-alcohol phosphatidyltransferase family protein [Bacteroidales bacterium]|nr:CDP-alcohol phosphatidyltransferase family protein [Bacteroidales bacterium]